MIITKQAIKQAILIIDSVAGIPVKRPTELKAKSLFPSGKERLSRILECELDHPDPLELLRLEFQNRIDRIKEMLSPDGYLVINDAKVLKKPTEIFKYIRQQGYAYSLKVVEEAIFQKRETRHFYAGLSAAAREAATSWSIPQIYGD